jgi:hypothetical protein
MVLQNDLQIDGAWQSEENAMRWIFFLHNARQRV